MPGKRTKPVVATVFGTRPQFVKLAALWRLLDDTFRSVLIDTGQHYDFNLAGTFHEVTDLRRPDIHLGVGSAPAAVQIGRIAEALDTKFARLKPAAVLVFGDTNSTAGGAIAAAYRNIPLAHIEAGLRSYDRQAPEEKNRLIADQLAQWRFAPTRNAIANLRREGMSAGTLGVGDLMYENWRRWKNACPKRYARDTYGLEAGAYCFVTCHRAETVDDESRLKKLIRVVGALRMPTVFALHPRARKNLRKFGLWSSLSRIRTVQLTSPLPYPDTLALVRDASVVLTDSGGLQREAYWSGTRCLVLRDRTEWKELAACGAVRTVDLDLPKITDRLARKWSAPRANDRVFATRHPSRKIMTRLVRDLS